MGVMWWSCDAYRYQVVESMRAGSSPTDATRDALSRIAKYYPGFQGALVAVNIKGQYGKFA